MLQALSSFTFRVVCQHGGSLDFKTLDQKLRPHVTVADGVLEEVLSDFEKFVVVAGRERKEDSVIITKTSLRVCRVFPGQCEGCETLHLCRYLVCGNCRFGQKCKNAHDLNSTHNAPILNKVGLQSLGQAELFQLLLQNDPFLLPEVCSHYNTGREEHGSCKYQTTCLNMHVCQHFLQEDCKYGAECQRAHGFDGTVAKLLNSRGLSPENIRNFHKIYKNKFLISSYKERPPFPSYVKTTASPNTVSLVAAECSSSKNKPESEADSNEICLFFLRRSCRFKDKCVRVHHHLPYKWQVLEKNGQLWKDLANGEEIERAYCNPANDESPEPQAVNFISMMCGGSPVRRLSTASSVTKPPHFILTTEWLWYWKNEKGNWVEYGQGVDEKHATPITSQTIENIYQSGTEIEFSVTSQKHTYMIFLKDMCQQNVLYKTKREIRRRPQFVSSLQVEIKLKSESPSSSSVVVPPQWDQGALPNFSYKLVTVSRSDADFLLVEKLFKQTLPKFTIINLQRNQNISLWKVFQWQKEQMKVRNGGREVDERLLFHGTNESLIEAICEQNFDWRICGKNGTLYGKGSYFAKDASYSDNYSEASNCKKMMLVARVLVGHYTQGKSSFVRPPAKINDKDFYDSCVDDVSNPNIFVIFEKFQVYPEFLIEYDTKESKCLIS